MKNHDEALLRILLGASIAVAIIAMLGAWQRFDYRAAGLAFSAAGAGMLAMYCLARLNELREDEHAEPTKLKCRDCGEVYEYYPFSEPPEGRESEHPMHCPICGGELDLVAEEANEDEPGA